MTSAGAVRLARQSFRRPACGDPAYPSDGRLGLEDFLSPQATRPACLAAASWSFDVAAAARGLYGEGAAEAARARRSLLGDGRPGLCDVAGATLAAGVSAAGRAVVDGLIGYFARHTGRLGYYGRLQAGRSIDGGAVEGLARRMGDRLNTTAQQSV